MPCVAARRASRIFQWLELQALERNADRKAVLDEKGFVRGYEVSHRTTSPHVAMQPQPAVHGVDHPVAAFRELPIRRRDTRHARG